MADFRNCFISPIFVAFSSGFLTQKHYNNLVECFFACFWHFKFLTQSDHFAKAMDFALAIAFVRWPIFEIVSFLQYLLLFRAVFHTKLY